ncbi:hypothetical protein SynSYN20_00605 [Synechococcus sp. SYN20]|nr:hypothetical protein SynSYN20_00605 [Synechococcus sp. SYN20]
MPSFRFHGTCPGTTGWGYLGLYRLRAAYVGRCTVNGQELNGEEMPRVGAFVVFLVI